jgi:hypothetical protein
MEHTDICLIYLDKLDDGSISWQKGLELCATHNQTIMKYSNSL